MTAEDPSPARTTLPEDPAPLSARETTPALPAREPTASGETWLILGASSPVARAFAGEAARRGCHLLLSGRDREDMEATAGDLRVRTGGTVDVLPLDVREFGDHPDFVERCVERRRGRLSVFVAVGTMPPQAEVDRNVELVRQVVEVNHLGPAALLSRLAPVLEAQGAGAVVALGSVAGDRGRVTNYAYGSAKAGLHAYLQGLRARLFRAGVSVTTVKPGFVDTSMTWGQPLPLPAASPEALARACWRHARRGTAVAYHPRFWRPVMAVLRGLPEDLFKRLRF